MFSHGSAAQFKNRYFLANISWLKQILIWRSLSGTFLPLCMAKGGLRGGCSLTKYAVFLIMSEEITEKHDFLKLHLAGI